MSIFWIIYLFNLIVIPFGISFYTIHYFLFQKNRFGSMVHTFIFVLAIFAIKANAQFSFTPLNGFETKTYIDGLIYSEVRDLGNRAFISIRDGISNKIVSWDISDSSNPTNI